MCVNNLVIMETVHNPSSDGIVGRLNCVPSTELAGAMVASAWCNSRAKRLLDFSSAVILLLITSPVILAAALFIKLLSPGPVFFRHRRCGKHGREFEVLKFRTMHHRQNAGPGVTRSGDQRITNIGRLLRKWKLDELPQLINVLRGEMSFVGPRPDLPQYYATLSDSELAVLALAPGITSLATLQFRDEESLLADVPPDQLENYYVTAVLPQKIHIELAYARSACFTGDLTIMFRTAAAIFHLGRSEKCSPAPAKLHRS